MREGEFSPTFTEVGCFLSYIVQRANGQHYLDLAISTIAPALTGSEGVTWTSKGLLLSDGE